MSMLPFRGRCMCCGKDHGTPGELEKLRHELECANDVLRDMVTQLDMISDALGVNYEPHQTNFERVVEAAYKAGKAADVNKQWFALVMEIGKRVGCLASSFPAGNAHILAKLPPNAQVTGAAASSPRPVD